MRLHKPRRLQAETKAVEPASQYARSLIEASLDPLVAISPEGKITDVNEATAKVMGVPRAGLIGADFADYFTEPDKAREVYQRAFSEGFVTDLLLTVRHREGQLTDLLCNASLYREAQGKVLGVLAAGRDVTEPRHVVREFVETKNFLDNILQSSTKHSIIATDLERHILSWNEGAYRSHGYTAAEIIGKNLNILHTPEDVQSGAADQLVSVAYEKGVAEGEFIRVRKDGSRFTASVVLTRGDDESGHPIGYLLISNDISEKKRAEEQLRSASRYSRSLIEASLDPLVTINPEGKITDVNEATVQATGVPRETIIGSDFASYFTEPEKALGVYQEVYAKGFVTDYPLAFRHASGKVIDVLYNASLYYDEKGSVAGVSAVARDITERKRAESLLNREREFSAALIDSPLIIFFVLDAKGRVIRGNDKLSTVTGWSKKEIYLMDSLRMVVAADHELARSKIREALEQGHAETEAGIIDRNGNVRRYLLVGQKLQLDDGPGIVGVGFDVTQARQAEELLKENEVRFRTITETAQIAIIMADGRNTVTYWNPAAERILGYTAVEARGKNIYEWVVPPRFRETVIQGLKEFAASGRSAFVGKTVELAALRKDGVEIPIELSIAAMRVGGEWQSVAILRDISEQKRAAEQILQMARFDVLTGLANRRVFAEAIEKAIDRARRKGESFAVLYLDLDHFKDVNDTMGHPLGDLLLKAVADRLRANTREIDTVARFGGDEFAILQTDVREPSDAGFLAQKLQAIFGQSFMIDGHEIRSGASIGIAPYGLGGQDAETLLSHADMALYRAKSQGRGTYRFFTEAIDVEVRARVALDHELREAMAAGQLFLLYQPQVDALTGAIVGVEALIGWRHPRRGLLHPKEFVPVAERTGLIVDLFRWVLREACCRARAWIDAGIAPLLMSVNISAAQFKVPGQLQRDIEAVLIETKLQPQLLVLELTESVLMNASREHNDVILWLREIGVRLAIDDFGTGYFSLDYLRRFPAYRIKIAQAFLLDIATNPGIVAIIKSVTALARELQIAFVAGGVETNEQLELLRSLGCQDVQGDYFCEPLAPEDLAPILRRGRIIRP